MIGIQVSGAQLNQLGGQVGLNLKNNYQTAVDINAWLQANPIASVQNVASVTRVGQVATGTFAAAHGYTTGQLVTFVGATQPEYNGTKAVTVVDATHVTFAVTGTPVTPATGAVTCGIDPLTLAPITWSGADADNFRQAFADLAYGKANSFDSSAPVKKLWGLGA